MKGGSGRGYHFISEWRTCPRKWFLHHVAGFEPTDLKAAPTTGTVLHKLQEAFYLGGYQDYNDTYESEIMEVMAPCRAAWFEDEEFFEAHAKICNAFKVWRNTYGMTDLAEFTTIATELHLESELPNGLIVSGNLDVVFRRNGSDVIVLKDTKTTSWSPESAHKKVELNDQVTMYTWLLQKHYGDVPIEMIPDIIYLKPRVPTVHRFGSIRRSKQDVETFIFGLCHDTMMLLDTLELYELNDAPPEYLFPRNATVCSEFGCEYEDICRAKFDEATPPPLTGFAQEERITTANLFVKSAEITLISIDKKGGCT